MGRGGWSQDWWVSPCPGPAVPLLEGPVCRPGGQGRGSQTVQPCPGPSPAPSPHAAPSVGSGHIISQTHQASPPSGPGLRSSLLPDFPPSHSSCGTLLFMIQISAVLLPQKGYPSDLSQSRDLVICHLSPLLVFFISLRQLILLLFVYILVF